jgi:hypothetical protein
MDVKGTTWFVRNQRTKSSYTGNEVMSAIIYTFKAVSCLPCSQTRHRAVDQFLAKRRVRIAATCFLTGIYIVYESNALSRAVTGTWENRPTPYRVPAILITNILHIEIRSKSKAIQPQMGGRQILEWKEDPRKTDWRLQQQVHTRQRRWRRREYYLPQHCFGSGSWCSIWNRS